MRYVYVQSLSVERPVRYGTQKQYAVVEVREEVDATSYRLVRRYPHRKSKRLRARARIRAERFCK